MNYRPVHIFLLFFSLILVTAGLPSCSYQHYKGFEKTSADNLQIPPVYDSAFDKAIYNTTLRVFNRELGGLTIVKQIKSTKSFHVVFMSQIGLKFFDIEVRPEEKEDGFRIHYIMESLNREFIIRAVKTDFMLLFAQYPENSSSAVFLNKETGATETTVRFEKYVASVFSGPDGRVTGIVFRKGHAEKTIIRITPGKDHPENLEIINKSGKVNISWEEIQM